MLIPFLNNFFLLFYIHYQIFFFKFYSLLYLYACCMFRWCMVLLQGGFCEKSIHCFSHRCRNRATCVEDANTYRCLCRTGYTGRLCQRRLRCADKPCVHSISCQDFVSTCKSVLSSMCCCRFFIGLVKLIFY